MALNFTRSFCFSARQYCRLLNKGEHRLKILSIRCRRQSSISIFVHGSTEALDFRRKGDAYSPRVRTCHIRHVLALQGSPPHTHRPRQMINQIFHDNVLRRPIIQLGANTDLVFWSPSTFRPPVFSSIVNARLPPHVLVQRTRFLNVIIIPSKISRAASHAPCICLRCRGGEGDGDIHRN